MSAESTTNKREKSVLFIHGLWIHASSWQSWIELFHQSGFEAAALTWPGDSETVEETRRHPEKLAGKGINNMVNHFVKSIDSMGVNPILIGHSFGGLFVQKLLAEGHASAAIAIDPAQMRGVLPLPLAQLKSSSHVFGNPFNFSKAIPLTEKQFRYGFGNAISEEESKELYNKWTIPGPARVLFQAAFANFNPWSSAKVNTLAPNRGPLLIIGGGKDHTVPEVVSRAAFKLYRKASSTNEYKVFPDRGHSLTLDHGSKEIANTCLSWLKEQGF